MVPASLRVQTLLTAGTDATTIQFGGGLEGLKRAAEEAARAGLPGMIERQAAAAVGGSHAIIFVVDGQVSTSSGFLRQ